MRLMKRIIAIGDIHGCAATFKDLLIQEFKLRKSDIVVCVGDYVDRGPDSKGVVDFILELRASKYKILTLRGNHEQIMMDSVHRLDMSRVWMTNGGDATLDSFGVNSYLELSDEYKSFFESTLHYWTYDKYIFVHGGLNMSIDDPFEDHHAMLWQRDTQSHPFLNERVLIHGHTPETVNKIITQRSSNIINLDAGCVYKNREGFGQLVGYSVLEEKFMSLPNRD
jgi:serine/threonine protein phosphatase 1